MLLGLKIMTTLLQPYKLVQLRKDSKQIISVYTFFVALPRHKSTPKCNVMSSKAK